MTFYTGCQNRKIIYDVIYNIFSKNGSYNDELCFHSKEVIKQTQGLYYYRDESTILRVFQFEVDDDEITLKKSLSLPFRCG